MTEDDFWYEQPPPHIRREGGLSLKQFQYALQILTLSAALHHGYRVGS